MDLLERITPAMGGAPTVSFEDVFDDDVFPAPPKEGDTCERECRTCGEIFTHVVTGHTAVDGTFYPLTFHQCDSCRDEEERERNRERNEDFRRNRFDSHTLHHDIYSDFGSRLARAAIADFKVGTHNRAAFAVARTWFEQPDPEPDRELSHGDRVGPLRPNLIIVGPIGCGKSYLAACLYRALRAELEPVLWINAGTLIAQVRRGFSEKEAAQEAGAKMEAAGRAPTLVLDDLGKVHPGKDVSWIEEQFYALVDERYRDELPTIVTTEWQSAPLAGRVGESVVSRLVDGAMVASIKAPETPYRRLMEVTP